MYIALKTGCKCLVLSLDGVFFFALPFDTLIEAALLPVNELTCSFASRSLNEVIPESHSSQFPPAEEFELT